MGGQGRAGQGYSKNNNVAFYKEIAFFLCIEISRKTDKILFFRGKLSQICVLKYEQSECFKLEIRDIFEFETNFV